MTQTYSGRKVLLVMLAIVAAVSVGFVAAVSLNLDLIRYAVKVNRSLPPELTLPSGDMVLAMEGRRPAFYIDKTEVTVRAYSRFLRSRGEPGGDAEGPATGVPAERREQFCAWAEKRLPTHAELRSTVGESQDDGFRCARSLPTP